MKMMCFVLNCQHVSKMSLVFKTFNIEFEELNILYTLYFCKYFNFFLFIMFWPTEYIFAKGGKGSKGGKDGTLAVV